MTMSWSVYLKEVETCARALISVGLQRFQCTNIMGFNSAEWFVADVATIFAGGIAAGVYTTNQTESCLYQAQHSEAAVIFVDNATQLSKYLPIMKNLPSLLAIVQWSGPLPTSELDKFGVKRGTSVLGPVGTFQGVYEWREFLRLGGLFSLLSDSRRGESAASYPGGAHITTEAWPLLHSHLHLGDNRSSQSCHDQP
jgi:hypothetical protein